MAKRAARREQQVDIDVYPQSDILDGAPHPSETETLFGHVPAQQALAEAFASGKMHHAWMITGPDGVGKATLAYQAAAFALSEPHERNSGLTVDPAAIARRQIIRMSHPGLLVIRRNYDIKAKRFPTTITIDEVRRLRGFLSHKTEAGQWRIVIVDRADELNLNAANAILKSLEEPPTNTIFFLLTVEPGRLLPTIRSRCRVLSLQPLAEDDLISAARAAHEAGQDGDNAETEPDWRPVMALAKGSVRRLLTLASPAGQATIQSRDSLLGAMPKVDWQQLHALADRLAAIQARQEFEMFFTLLQERLADLIRARAMPNAETVDAKLAMQLIPEGRLASWAELWETLHREKAEVQTYNHDRAAFLIDVFARIQQAATR